MAFPGMDSAPEIQRKLEEIMSQECSSSNSADSDADVEGSQDDQDLFDVEEAADDAITEANILSRRFVGPADVTTLLPDYQLLSSVRVVRVLRRRHRATDR